VGTQGLSHFLLGRTNPELGYGGLVLSAASESVSLLIRALKETRRMEVLGRPQIMTLDNQAAFIQVGQRVPRITGTRFAGLTQTNEIELENIGLILGVTPRISPDGMVVMEIDAEKSELAPESEAIPVSVSEGAVVKSPSIDVTTAQTTVSAASGETIVIGGLISKSQSTVRRRVPVLSDIPILGDLFRYDADVCKREELLIFLTPHVVRTPEDAELIKRTEAARMNWCLGEVHEIHGPTGIYDDRDMSEWHGQGEVVYPDTNPQGLTPGKFSPKQVPMENLELSPAIEELPTPEQATADDDSTKQVEPRMPAPRRDWPDRPFQGERLPPAIQNLPADPKLNGTPNPGDGALTLPGRSHFVQGLHPTQYTVPLDQEDSGGSVRQAFPTSPHEPSVPAQAQLPRRPYQ
jgi:hypothetical protein